MREIKDEWYTARELSEGLWAIDDHGQGNFYAVIGERCALTIDNGWGAGKLDELLGKLSPLPWFTVNTHGDIDHALGNHFFDIAYLGEADFFMLSDEEIDEKRRQVTGGASAMEALQKTFRAPGGCHGKCHTYPLHDGQVFDLGGRQVTAWFTPGHTPGSFCFTDNKSKTLFTGDMYVPLQEWNAMWMHLPRCTTLRVMYESVERMRALRPLYDRMVSGHGGNYALEPARLDELSQGLTEILSGARQGTPEDTPMGSGLYIAFDRWGLVYDPDRLEG